MVEIVTEAEILSNQVARRMMMAVAMKALTAVAMRVTKVAMKTMTVETVETVEILPHQYLSPLNKATKAVDQALTVTRQPTATAMNNRKKIG
jgi:hypothetical protein